MIAALSHVILRREAFFDVARALYSYIPVGQVSAFFQFYVARPQHFQDAPVYVNAVWKWVCKRQDFA